MSDLVERLRAQPTERTYDSVGRAYDFPKHLIEEAASRISQQDAELERVRREVDRLEVSNQTVADELGNEINRLLREKAEARKAAFIEAAEMAENYSELRDIDWWLNATKKEVSADACVSIGTILRKKAEETRT